LSEDLGILLFWPKFVIGRELGSIGVTGFNRHVWFGVYGATRWHLGEARKYVLLVDT